MASFFGEGGEVPEYLKYENQIPNPTNIALFHAAKAGNVEKVKASLGEGGMPNYFHLPDEQKNSLHIAAEKGYVEIIKLLCDHGAVPNVVVGTTKDSALLLAVQHNQLKTAELLISLGCDVNLSNCYGNTPLHEAAHLGYVELAALLLQHGADRKVANHKGSTPLHFMCYCELPTDPEKAAVMSQKSIALVKMLVEAGAEVNALDSQGISPLLACCVSGRMDIITVLIALGADPKLTDNKGRTAYDIGTFYNQEKIYQHFGKDSPINRFLPLSADTSTSSLSTHQT